MKNLIYILTLIFVLIGCNKNEIEETKPIDQVIVDINFLNNTNWSSPIFSYNSNHVVQNYVLSFDSIGNSCNITVSVEKDSIRKDYDLKEGNYNLVDIRLISDKDTLTFFSSVISKRDGIVLYNNKGKCFGFFKK